MLCMFFQRTFFGCCSSSAGYHFLAFWLGCGTVLFDFPKVFSWGAVAAEGADIVKEKRGLSIRFVS